MPRKTFPRPAGDSVVELKPPSRSVSAFLSLADGNPVLAERLADIASNYEQARDQDAGATAAGHNTSLRVFIAVIEQAKRSGAPRDRETVDLIMFSGLDDLASSNLCNALSRADPKRSYNDPAVWTLEELRDAARAAILPPGPRVDQAIDSAAYDLAVVYQAITNKKPTACHDVLGDQDGKPTSKFGKFVIAFFEIVDPSLAGKPPTRLNSAVRRARECRDRVVGTNSSKTVEPKPRSATPIRNQGGSHAYQEIDHQPAQRGPDGHRNADRGAGGPGPQRPRPSG